MKNKIRMILLFMACSTVSMAQVGIGTTSPNANATLELSSTSQGMLFPRMTTTQRDAIVSPAKGLTIFNTSHNCIQTNVGSSTASNWISFAIKSNSSNGTAIVSSYTIGDSTGTLTVGTAVSGVTQTINATVIAAGNYYIFATVNGVTYSAIGTFNDIGSQNIVLTASGTPTVSGTGVTFNLNTITNVTGITTSYLFLKNIY